MEEFVALIGTYQDVDGGKRLVRNLDELGIPSIWADSRVEPFQQINGSDYSTDGLREIVSGYENTTWHELGKTVPGEGANFLLRQAAKKYKHCMILSCDEYLSGDVTILMDSVRKQKLQSPARCGLQFIEHNPKNENCSKDKVDRLIYLPEYVFIEQIHWMYFHNYYGKKQVLLNNPRVDGMTIHHDDSIRPKWRNELMDEFQRKRKPVEMEAWQKLIN